MKYTLEKGNVIYITSRTYTFNLNCIQGRIWVTKFSDIKDFILAKGDRITIEAGKKSAIQAFEEICLNLEGQAFDLTELIKKNHRQYGSTVKIRMKNWVHWEKVYKGWGILLNKAYSQSLFPVYP